MPDADALQIPKPPRCDRHMAERPCAKCERETAAARAIVAQSGGLDELDESYRLKNMV